ncbi:MAG: class II aldolase [Alphaproteobacteria bacterium]|jgi:rhamnose utilization protein RhaD (predicted bifunctional aldolase and dehydrogenase)|nr:class II aldolase [Alphaproteobacteria bacterium]
MTGIPKDFRNISQAVGADALLIQGAGGNSSIKIDANLMWVKASGKWLQHAGDDDVFVAVDQAMINQNIADGITDPVAGASLPVGPVGLRPSIETTLHSLMQHRVVFHTHSINTIVHAVQKNAADILTPKLAGLRWGFVPYSQPGLPLTRLVADILASQPCDVLVIQNHGLVVGGDSAEQALALMNDVESRLKTEAAAMKQPTVKALLEASSGTESVVAESDIVHQLALHPSGFDQACARSLYPDHVVFLGSGIAGVQSADELAAWCRVLSDDPLRPKAIALKGAGVLHSKSLSAGGLEMLKALAEVSRRAPASSDIRYLSDKEEKELVNWDAEKYRQTLSALNPQQLIP